LQNWRTSLSSCLQLLLVAATFAAVVLAEPNRGPLYGGIYGGRFNRPPGRFFGRQIEPNDVVNVEDLPAAPPLPAAPIAASDTGAPAPTPTADGPSA
jgi:hypothetical protein